MARRCGTSRADLRFHGFLYFFQNARHDAYDVGPVYGQQFLQIVGIAVGDADAFVEVAIAERALQNVRQRQHRERLMGGIGGTRARLPRRSDTILPCESITPLGVPVVPEV